MIFVDYFAERLPIESAQLQEPADKKWTSLAHYMGPANPKRMHPSLEYKSSNGLTMLMSACLTWSAIRLRPLVETKELEDLAEALFFFQFSHTYLKYSEMDQFLPDTEGLKMPEGVIASLPYLFFNEYFDFPDDRFLYPPVICCAEIISLVKYSMPKRGAAFSKWVKAVFPHLQRVAPLPNPRVERFSPDATLQEMQTESERIAGAPLGPSALNPNKAFDQDENALELKKLVALGDPSNNRFLNDAATMRTLGFEGTPYELQK